MIPIISTQGATSAVLIPPYKSCQRAHGDLSSSELRAVSLAHKKKTGKRWKDGVPGLQISAKGNFYLLFISLGGGRPKGQPLL